MNELEELVADAVAKEVARLAIAVRLDAMRLEYLKLNNEHDDAAREATNASAKVANLIDKQAREQARRSFESDAD
jgi:hypothetical protein